MIPRDFSIRPGLLNQHQISDYPARIYYVEEDEGFLTVDIMGLGSMNGIVKVQYSTDACLS